MDKATPHRPFQLNIQFNDPIRRKLFPVVKAPLEKALLLSRMNRIYETMEKGTDVEGFIKEALDRLQLGYQIPDTDYSRIPEKGPVIVIMNHPFGGIEGLLVSSLLLSRRKDIKIMANFLLASIPGMTDLFIPVDPFDRKKSRHRNIKALRESIRWVDQGGMLVVFPSGEVSHFQFKERRTVDPPWNPGVLHTIQNTQAPVLPIFFKGKNGPFFQIAGLIHPRLRTALLPREILNKQNRSIEVRVGSLIPSKNMAVFSSPQDQLAYLRQRTYMLEYRLPPWKDPIHLNHMKITSTPPVISPLPSAALTREIRNLQANQVLLSHGEYKVAISYAAQTPLLLRELGRLRELTFRQSGEGTGKEIDLDLYDTYYQHLFLWKEDTQEIVGAYRLGQTDHLLTRLGRKGFYTQTLFSFQPAFFSRIHPALELGRSFVRVEYQKSYNALLLLWKGIGRYVARNPRYRFLFGPVSITNEYQKVSRMLMVTYLRDHNFMPEMAKWIKPKKPFSLKPDKWMEKAARYLINDIDEVSSWVSELENEPKGIPVLLKQYLKLGGKLLGFNIDPLFSNALDGLILVDLLKTDRRLLERYMGKEGLESFLSSHDPNPDRAKWEEEPPRRAA
jgi:putative hemolysin